MRSVVILIAVALVTFFGCKENQQQQKGSSSSQVENRSATKQQDRNKLLPFSTGKISGLYLYVDKSFENSALLDTLKYNLNQPYLLIPVPTPVIDVNQYQFETFKSGGTRSANNLMLINMQEQSAMSDFVQEQLGKTKVAEAMAGKEITMIRVKDVNASPQQIFYLLSNGMPNLSSKQVQSTIDQYVERIIEEMTLLDNKRLVSSFSSNRNRGIEQIINNQFNFQVWIPETYEVVIEEDDFLWVINENNDLYSNIVVYRTAYDDTIPLEKQVLPIRDEFGQKITTMHEGSRMTTNVDKKPTPIVKEIDINGTRVLETRGLWQMVNDRLGGGFLNYTWIQDGQIITIDGFVYTDRNDQRKRMRDIDAIFSTIDMID